jgi:hypothetical protein
MNRGFKDALAPVVIALFLFSGKSLAVPTVFRLTGEEPIKGLVDNVISVLTYDGEHLWAGTGGGISRSVGDPTLKENWITYARTHGLCGNSISAIAMGPGAEIWAASVGDTVIGEDELLYGAGLSHAFPPYEEWTCEEQPGETPMQNVTYDIAINVDTLWIASWGGGCLSAPYTGLWRSIDNGTTWERIALQGGPVDPPDPQGHVAFSVIAWDSWVWVGTAGGVYKSTDSGSTWVNYNHQNSNISGDFVVSLAVQYLEDDFLIWAGTKPTGPAQFTAISMSADTGKTWQVLLGGSIGEGAWNFAFLDTTVWAATSKGLMKTTDLGQTWSEYNASDGLPSSEVYSVAVVDSTVWAGTLDGLAYTQDGGETWDFFRISPPTALLDGVVTYAYPNPFSPNREELGAKIRYSLQSHAQVTIKIYDFALDLVRTIGPKSQPGGEELWEYWDGKNDQGAVVANGVYFYKIKIDKGTEAFGKIVVLD